MKTKIITITILSLLAIMTFIFSINCFSQDSVRKVKILYLENTKLKAGQTQPSHKIFRVGNKIKIKRYLNDTIVRGKIESIDDSSITLKSKVIVLKDIKCIKKAGGNKIFIVGALTPFAAACIGYISSTPDYRGFSVFAGIVDGILIGCFIELAGVISLIAERNFHLDKDYIIMVKTLKKNK